MAIYLLSEGELTFPNPRMATSQGILALGGDLSPERLILAYQHGIFPWFNPDEPILWWSPDPRFVLFPEELKVSKSMRPYFNQRKFDVTFDRHFEEIMRNCQNASRKGQMGETWITEDMIEAYVRLYDMGLAHSVEVWKGDEIVGGLYGIALGKCFFGESMFTKVSNASKFGFISMVRKLREKSYWLVDCQQQTRHLASMGARSILREEFLTILDKNLVQPTQKGHWINWAHG